MFGLIVHHIHVARVVNAKRYHGGLDWRVTLCGRVEIFVRAGRFGLRVREGLAEWTLRSWDWPRVRVTKFLGEVGLAFAIAKRSGRGRI